MTKAFVRRASNWIAGKIGGCIEAERISDAIRERLAMPAAKCSPLVGRTVA
jgi:hypothetical protein